MRGSAGSSTLRKARGHSFKSSLSSSLSSSSSITVGSTIEDRSISLPQTPKNLLKNLMTRNVRLLDVDPNEGDNDSSAEEEGGMPMSVKIGMSVGFGVAMLLMIAFICLCLRERRKRVAAEKKAAKAEKRRSRKAAASQQSASKHSKHSKHTTKAVPEIRVPRPKASWSDETVVSSSNNSWIQADASEKGLWRPTPPPEKMSRASVVSKYWGEDNKTTSKPDLRLYSEADAGPVDEKRLSRFAVEPIYYIEKDSLSPFPDPRLYSEKE